MTKSTCFCYRICLVLIVTLVVSPLALALHEPKKGPSEWRGYKFKEQDIKKAKLLGANCVEIHTGKFCNLFNLNKSFSNEFIKIKKVVQYANIIGLEVHAGHGLTYQTAKMIKKIKKLRRMVLVIFSNLQMRIIRNYFLISLYLAFQGKARINCE